MSDNLVFNVNATLLQHFLSFFQHPSEEKRVDFLSRINGEMKYNEVLMQKFEFGRKFERAVLTHRNVDFSSATIEEAQALLPKPLKTQVKLTFLKDNVQFTGYADAIGQNRIVDIKTTSCYFPNKYVQSFQLLYLYSLMNQGINKMDFLIYDFNKIYIESYPVDYVDFDFFFDIIENYKLFIVKYLKYIKNKNVIINGHLGPLFD